MGLSFFLHEASMDCIVLNKIIWSERRLAVIEFNINMGSKMPAVVLTGKLQHSSIRDSSPSKGWKRIYAHYSKTTKQRYLFFSSTVRFKIVEQKDYKHKHGDVRGRPIPPLQAVAPILQLRSGDWLKTQPRVLRWGTEGTMDSSFVSDCINRVGKGERDRKLTNRNRSINFSFE
jgi:hypothetical protein